MTQIYRVRYRKGNFELDIESSDKAYIDAKLAELTADEGSVVSNAKSHGRGHRTSSQQHAQKITSPGEITESVLANIISSINDAQNYEALAKHVLDRSDRTGRILMCFYFAHKHPTDPALTTNHVEQITAQLGVRIEQPNVAKVIRQRAGQYLTADRVRKRGFATHYRINRRGIALFERITSSGAVAPPT